MNRLNLRHLGYFRAVAHEGNLTRAATKLGLSQSALSVQIRDLEARLGHPLFERTQRKLALTEAGRIALDHADAIFATGEELLATLKGENAAQATLRIGALATLSRNFQLAFLQPLLERGDLHLVLRSGGPSLAAPGPRECGGSSRGERSEAGPRECGASSRGER